jgi:hypothetical protein
VVSGSGRSPEGPAQPCRCPATRTSFCAIEWLPPCSHTASIMVPLRSLLEEEPMPDVALRGMSPELHQTLKRAAEKSHRSLNGEILARLGASLLESTVDVAALLARIEMRKARSGASSLDTDQLRTLKAAGRQ